MNWWRCCQFSYLFIYLGVLRRFQHCTGHITAGSWKGGGNQCIQFVRVLYCKLPANCQLPAFPLEAVPGTEPRWEARVLPLGHRGPCCKLRNFMNSIPKVWEDRDHLKPVLSQIVMHKYNHLRHPWLVAQVKCNGIFVLGEKPSPFTCKLLTIGKQLPAFPHGGRGLKPRPQREVGGQSDTTATTLTPPWSK